MKKENKTLDQRTNKINERKKWKKVLVDNGVRSVQFIR